MTLPKSFGVDLSNSKWSAGLKHRFRKGFVYSDARVDDARLVVANALDAKARGADIRVRTKLTSARGARAACGGRRCSPAAAHAKSPRARSSTRPARGSRRCSTSCVREKAGEGNVRHVKGSHIVVPRVHAEAHAYILQNADHRIVFVIPYQEHYSLIGTTDVPVEAYEHPQISDDETQYLLDLANAYLERPLTQSRHRVDLQRRAAAVRRRRGRSVRGDARLRPEGRRAAGEPGPDRAPVLSSFGGKITTYRKLAEHALRELAPYFPGMKHAWTAKRRAAGRRSSATAIAPRGLAELSARYPKLSRGALARACASARHARDCRCSAMRSRPRDLGVDFGADLTAREVDYLVREEWARTADDVLWRRTKCGLPMTQAQRDAVAAYLGASRMKRVCLFCGSNVGARPVYAQAAADLGRALAGARRDARSTAAAAWAHEDRGGSGAGGAAAR